MVQAARERYRALDAKIERMEAEEERRWQQACLQPCLRHGEVETARLRRIRPLGAAAILSGVSAGGVVLSLAKPSGATGYCIVASGNLWKDTRFSLKPGK
jgi:hypothetical protein